MNKKYLKYGIIFLLYLVFVLAPVLFAAIYLKQYTDIIYILSAVCISVLFLIAVINVTYNIISKKMNFNITEIRSKLMQEKENINKNYKYYYKKLKFINILGNIYSVFLIVFTVVIMMGGILTYAEGLSYGMGIILLCIFFHLALLFRIFLRIKDPISLETKLNESDYPKLFKIIREVAELCGLTENINMDVYAYMDNKVSIGSLNWKYYLYIDVMYLRLLTEKELSSVLIHEFAHILNGDVKLLQKMSKVNIRWQTLAQVMSFAWKIFFSFIGNKILFYYDKFELLASMNKEINADKLVKDKGRDKDYVNATAKVTMYGLYENSLASYNYYKCPEYYDNNLGNRFDGFIQAYEKNKETWRHICKNELPARVDTHPTFSERLKYFGAVDFETEFFFSEEQRLLEVGKAFEMFNKLLRPEKREWEKSRQNFYLKYVDIIKNYESGAQNEELNTDIADAYFQICDYDKSLALYGEILSSNPKNAEAAFRKGMIMLDRFDNGGMDLIITAIENNINYYENGLLMLIQYIKNMGLKERKEELNDWVDTRVNEMLKVYPQLELNYKDKLYKTILPQSVIEEVAAKIKEFPEIKSCYIARKKINGGPDRNIVFVDFTSMSDLGNNVVEYNNMSNVVLEKIFRFLDEHEEFFMLYDTAAMNPAFLKKVKKIEGSKII